MPFSWVPGSKDNQVYKDLVTDKCNFSTSWAATLIDISAAFGRSPKLQKSNLTLNIVVVVVIVEFWLF